MIFMTLFVVGSILIDREVFWKFMGSKFPYLDGGDWI